MSNQKKVLVFSAVEGLGEKIFSKLKDHHVYCPKTRDEFMSFLPMAEIILTDPDQTFISEMHKAKNCKWLQSTWAGVDGFFKNQHIQKPDFEMTRFGGTFGKHISEYCLQHILNHERHYSLLESFQQHSEWKQSSYPMYRTLDELNIGVLGYGDIGKEVCRVAKFFKMTVSAYKTTKIDFPQYVDQIYVKDELNSFLKDLDYVISTLPSTKETNDLLSGDVLRNCERSPVFINVGRGNVIKEESILTALQFGWITKAILDVFEKEPLSSESKLWNHQNVVITPHVSARTFEKDISKLFFENFELYLNNQPLKYSVNWDRGY